MIYMWMEIVCLLLMLICLMNFVDRWRKIGDEKHTDIPRLTDERHTPQGLYYHEMEVQLL